MNTVHSILRAKERTGKNYSEAVRFIELAVRNGQRAAELPGLERSYLESKETDSSITAILYNGFIFIMKDEETCITLFQAPEWFFKKQYFDGKKQVRNIRKYLRYYDYGMEAA